jgi:hypothetical protein
MLGHFFHSGRAADLILLFMALEFIVLGLRQRMRARRGAVVDLAFAIAPGVCLVLALRAALTGSALVWIAAPLAVSLPVHLADLARRRL